MNFAEHYLNTTTSEAALNRTNTTRPPFTYGKVNVQLSEKQIVALVFYTLLGAFIVFGNTLVLTAFKINPRLRTIPNYFIFSLAIADLFIGLLSIPLKVMLSVTGIELIQPRRPVYSFYLALDIICGTSSILNLTCISLERSYALLRPIQHRNINRGIIALGIVLSWSLAGVAGLLSYPKIKVPLYGFTVTIAWFLVPLLIILFAYSIIFSVARAHIKSRGQRTFKKDLRLATTIAVVIGLFIVCWAPFFATNSFFSLCSKVDKTRKLCMTYPFDIADFIKFLQYGNSACNPVIYGFRNKDFQRAFRKMLMRLICKKVPLTHFRSTMGGTSRFANKVSLMHQDSSFGDSSRSIVFTDQVSKENAFDNRASYRKAISNGRKKPIYIKKKLKKNMMKGKIETSNTNGFATELNFDTQQTSVCSLSEDEKLPSQSSDDGGKPTKKQKSRLRVKFNSSTKGGSIIRQAKEKQQTSATQDNKLNHLSPNMDDFQTGIKSSTKGKRIERSAKENQETSAKQDNKIDHLSPNMDDFETGLAISLTSSRMLTNVEDTSKEMNEIHVNKGFSET